MKRRLLVQMSLLILTLIVQVGCGNQTSTPTDTPPPTEVTPTDTPTEVATEVTPTDTPTEVPTEVPTPTEAPAIPIAPVLKPSLIITDEQGVLSSAGITPGHVIGFTFPNGLVALKATAITDPFLDDEGTRTVVGVVEVGEGADKITTGVHTVAINLSEEGTTVSGRLVLQGGEGEQRDLTFARIPMERNEDREDDPSIPTISPTISSNEACFVIGFADGVIAPDSAAVQDWFRYCSLASTDTDELILSVRDNFPSQYRELIGQWETSIALLKEKFPQEDVNIDFDSTISELEGFNNINACNDTQECNSDLTGAPNTLFWEQYLQAKEKAEGNSFIVTVAIARIERLIEIPDQDTIPQGIFFLRLSFDKDEIFIGAALLGVTVDDELILGQSIPAISAYLIDIENPDNPDNPNNDDPISWISAWRARRWCALQRCT